MNRGKCLALAAVLAMVVCAFAIAMPAGDSDVSGTPAASASTVSANPTEDFKLTEDVTQSITIDSGVNIKLDLAGFSITNTADQHTITINNGGKLTVVDTSEGKTGKVINITEGAYTALAVYHGGEAVLNGGLFQNVISAETEHAWYVINNHGKVTIDGAKVQLGTDTVKNDKYTTSSIKNGWSGGAATTRNGNDLAAHADGQIAEVIIKSGTVSGGGYVKNDEFGKMTISGGTISGKNAAVYSCANLTVTGGSFSTETENKSALYLDENNIEDNAKTTVTGGTFTVVGGSERGAIYVIGTGNTLSINLATLSAPIVIGDGAVLDGTITLGSGETAGTLVAKNIKAGSGEITLFTGSIQISGEFTKDAETGNITVTGNAVITGTSTLDAGVTLTVAEGATLKVDANLTVKGTLANNGKVAKLSTASLTFDSSAGAAKYVMSPESEIVNVDSGTQAETEIKTSDLSGATVESSAAESDDAIGLKNYLESDYTIVGKAFLAGNLTIKEGVTLTIASSGSLSLDGYQLIVLGNLVVKNGGTIDAIGSTATEGIVLNKTSYVMNEGLIGKGTTPVKFIFGSDNVSVQNVMGAQVDVIKYNGDYVLTLSGNLIKEGTSKCTVTAKGTVYVDDDLTIGIGVSFNAGTALKVIKSVTVTVNGEIGGNVELMNGAIISLNGTTVSGGVTVKAKVGTYTSSDKTMVGTNDLSVRITDVTGVNLYVTSYTYMDSGTSKTEQKMLIDGIAALTAGKTSGSIEVTGTSAEKLYVEGEFYIPTAITSPTTAVDLTVISAKIEVTGKITSNKKFDSTMTGYLSMGTVWSVSTTTAVTAYITTFDEAFSNLDAADQKTITVYGTLSLDSAYEIDAKQTVAVAASAELTVTDNGAITVKADGVLSGTVKEVTGVLYVMYGASAKAPTSYAVKTVIGYDVQYSGLAVAISQAGIGSVINLVQEATVNGNFTVPAGVTLKVSDTGKLNAKMNLDVQGTLENAGAVTVDGETTVSGSFDTSSGTFTPEKDVTVTGTMRPAAGTDLSSKYNGVVYTDDDGTIITSLDMAALAMLDDDIARTIVVYGKVSETSAVAFENVTITVMGTASFSDLTLSGASSLVVTGKLSGSIFAETGTDGSLVDAEISLVEAQSMTIATAVVPNAANVDVYYLYIKSDVVAVGGLSPLTGKVSVDKGTVTQNGNVSVDAATGTLTVASGATYVVASGQDLKAAADKSVIVNGDLQVNGTLDSVAMTVAGKLVVPVGGAVTVTAMTVKGALDVQSYMGTYGTFTVTGVLTVGTAPASVGAAASVTGKVVLSGAGYIKAYAGSDMSAAVFADDVKSTAYSVNGTAYLTAYAIKNSVKINDVVTKLSVTGYVPQNPAVWINGSTKVVDQKVGDFDAVAATLEIAVASITVSVGNGMTMYIDGIRVEYIGTVDLLVGSHVVTISANAGYSIDNAVIQFNGQTVQNGGSITITADMVGAEASKNVLASSGATATSPVTPTPDKGGNGITDILLIVLVVLIAIMAIMVALRMMRS